MPNEPPTPPAELPSEIINTLDGCPPERLRAVSRYSDELADYKERMAGLEEDQSHTRPEDLPDDVPARATVTIKEINDNRYYYWQWREGEKVTSKYKGPVNPDESD